MNKKLCLIITLTLFCFNCELGKKSNNQSIAKRDNLNKNGLELDDNIILKIEHETNKKSEPFKREVWKYYKDKEEEKYFLDTGIVFKFIDENKAHKIFNKFYDKVISSGNYIFLTNLNFDESYNSYYDIVIINYSDPFKIIRLIGTDGINYDLYNNDIVKKLKEWDKQVNFKVAVIDAARIHAYMQKLPEDISKFTDEVYKFCPDVIDQGYESMNEMVKDYNNNKYFWLWWD